jgi:hypothetical protein
MTTLSNIAAAIVAAMSELKNIDKTKDVGVGRNAYKGVEDKEVKMAVRAAMIKHGLSMLPISVDAKTTTERWMETYNGESKAKQSVFTEVRTRYLLLHTSGESIELEGYGQGQDTQDKSAGKATTYALKNALLYAFMIPTGAIDDTDSTHSESAPIPRTAPAAQANPADDNKPWLDAAEEAYVKAMEWVKGKGEDGMKTALGKLTQTYKVNKTMREALKVAALADMKLIP